LIALYATSAPASCSGTISATPANAQILRNEGMLFYGSFGDPAANVLGLLVLICVSASHPQYSGQASMSVTTLAVEL
jgi:hypothetical protein